MAFIGTNEPLTYARHASPSKMGRRFCSWEITRIHAVRPDGSDRIKLNSIFDRLDWRSTFISGQRVVGMHLDQ
jgi:hypothetical protein